MSYWLLCAEGDGIVTAQQFREVREANPFRPFTIHLADGQSIIVPHRDFVSQSPGGRTIFVYGSNESFRLVDLYLITRVEVQAPADAGSQTL
jgi:hypothetical protein